MHGIEQDKDVLKEKIVSLTGLPSHRVKNIYIYGSRVYGLHTVNSDYDAIVTANSMYLNHEIFDGEYNIHITTPDSFEDKLRKHDIHCLECIYAPDEALVQVEKDYLGDFDLNPMTLKKMLLSQSSAAWAKARRRIENCDVIGGAKSLFHSIRILRFGLQVLDNGRIVDFECCNKLWPKIEGFESIEWRDYKYQFEQVRKQAIKEFKRHQVILPNGVMSDAFDNASIGV